MPVGFDHSCLSPTPSRAAHIPLPFSSFSRFSTLIREQSMVIVCPHSAVS